MFSSSSLSTFNNNSVGVSVSVSPTMFCVDSYVGDDFNPNSKQDDPSYQTSYYHSPSPLICNEIDIFGDSFSSLHELAIIQQASWRPNSTIVTDDSSTFAVITKMDSNKGQETINGIVEDGNKNSEVTKPSSGLGLKRRRTSKRDRHSKIRTAHGLRDRRMRLSLEVACPFFKLQDMLGYDKASSTVEWLLLQAKPAIQELFQSKNASSSGVTKSSMSNSTSNCEVESTIVEEKKGTSKGKRASKIAKENKPKQKRKSTTKEARKEARARARMRTFERLQSRGLKGNDGRLRAHSSFQPFKMIEGCNESNSQTHNGTNSIETQDIIDPGSLTTEDWSPLPSFAYQSSEISQSVPSYRISIQQNIMGGPR